MAKPIMIQGTASSVGKSIIAAALCRIFYQDGYSVAPFKSQNMALNSYITDEGLEMGRAQAVQAEACRINPSVTMNPILIKPSGDSMAQIIVNGKVYKNLDVRGYHDYKEEAVSIIRKSFSGLSNEFDIIVIEGAGSPAEINIKDNDIVNMRMAEIADSPVIIAADIDKGGVFAQVVGTMFLLEEDERSRVKGIIINKFRGDIDLLKPGIVKLEDIIEKPVLGVIPHTRLNIDDEDGVTERLRQKSEKKSAITIDVIKLPYISNFTDFNVFDLYDDVNLRFVETAREIDDPDIIIIPGSKNSILDMEFIKNEKIDKKIIELYNKDRLVVGICGGYQMLGKSIEDPYGVEGNIVKTDGIGILGFNTVLAQDKVTKQVKGVVITDDGCLRGLKGKEIGGYEIHMGRSYGEFEGEPFIETEQGKTGLLLNNLIGTYIHGIFDNSEFTRGLLDNVREKKGLGRIQKSASYSDYREKEYNRLADIVRTNLDMKEIYRILENK